MRYSGFARPSQRRGPQALRGWAAGPLAPPEKARGKREKREAGGGAERGGGSEGMGRKREDRGGGGGSPRKVYALTFGQQRRPGPTVYPRFAYRAWTLGVPFCPPPPPLVNRQCQVCGEPGGSIEEPCEKKRRGVKNPPTKTGWWAARLPGSRCQLAPTPKNGARCTLRTRRLTSFDSGAIGAPGTGTQRRTPCAARPWPCPRPCSRRTPCTIFGRGNRSGCWRCRPCTACPATEAGP